MGPRSLRVRLRPRYRRDWLYLALTLANIANSLRRRRRLSALTTLAADATATKDSGHFVAFTGPGVQLADSVRAAATSYARAEHLDVVDLVPEDLPVDQALELAGLIDPATYRSSGLTPGHGALHAVLVNADVARRAGLAGAGDGDDRNGNGDGDVAVPDWSGMAELMARLKLYAPRSSDLAVDPGLRAVSPDPDGRLEILRARNGPLFPLAVATRAMNYALLLDGPALSPAWAARRWPRSWPSRSWCCRVRPSARAT